MSVCRVQPPSYTFHSMHIHIWLPWQTHRANWSREINRSNPPRERENKRSNNNLRRSWLESSCSWVLTSHPATCKSSEFECKFLFLKSGGLIPAQCMLQKESCQVIYKILFKKQVNSTTINDGRYIFRCEYEALRSEFRYPCENVNNLQYFNLIWVIIFMQERVCLHSRFVCKWNTQIITFCNIDGQHPSAVNVNET